ncbi:MAG: hypothetical protein ACKVQS_01235 [Fimbriimonadaceae bacterium]
MNQQNVHRDFADRDPKWLKRFFLGFFLLLPISGLLLFWVDGHAKIEKEALNYTNSSVIPVMKSWNREAVIDLVTPEVADEVREGKYDWVQTDLGNLKTVTRLDADRTRAREEQDHGVVYAEVDFSGAFEKGNARVHMLLTRKSTETQWFVKKLEIAKK